MANGLVMTLNSEFKRKVQVAVEMQERTGLPLLTGRQSAFMNYAFFEAIDMNDLLNLELRNDSPKMFDQAWRDIDGDGQ